MFTYKTVLLSYLQDIPAPPPPKKKITCKSQFF